VVVMLVQRNALEQMFFQSMKIVRGQKKRARGGARVVGWIGLRAAGGAAGGRELEEDEKKIAAEGGSREAQHVVKLFWWPVCVFDLPSAPQNQALIYSNHEFTANAAAVWRWVWWGSRRWGGLARGRYRRNHSNIIDGFVENAQARSFGYSHGSDGVDVG